ncbi:MAG: hypothetical protein A2275_07365 [Bacteroidetes bacterium RIFOXYA12_FULL_35_11]|nr:MAG: hypothetical protein A2X01_06455 [Bacteroidetes bacterium GWF2_35_48]OFY73067.1 MAG: hypothetical protein A2275_07365 [Bacteroidetes bacterium RIFOXYA12_FULL_35_11]OFY94631.1 MAG: hypothetical protein A2491_08955 [Bacteroidetes bacterium RIFOXYC12_FULL_35_7]OFY97428.1 MAG: hypothetical protein A2309_04030 [Bacteroidetes bacterium RIFOXYB2_FULL_35_7]HBX53535.1 hypothetical protein [Bacteroidales bacterium]
MKFNHRLNFFINDKQYTFRTLLPEDVSPLYVQSLNEERTFIENVPELIDINSQKEYISSILSSKHDSICGLFLENELIGTAGIQNLLGKDQVIVVDGYTNNSTIGILVLSKAIRGIGYGKTLVWAGCLLANKCYGINIFEACMFKTNPPSLKAFLACGFSITKENLKSYNVELNIKNLNPPGFIDVPSIHFLSEKNNNA